MVNQDRIKQLYKLAVYEKTEEKEHREAGQYYRSDYVGKEIIKSIFSGTFAYGIIAMLWVMNNWELVMYQINTLEITNTLVTMLIYYVAFMAVYLIGTMAVYYSRYNESKKKIDTYVTDLKAAQSMFEREEKLKA